MKIALVVDSYKDKSNGTSMTAFRFARELIKRGHEVRVVATDASRSIKAGERGEAGEILYPVQERYIPLVTEISHKQHMIFGLADPKILRQALSGCDVAHFFLPFGLEIAGVHLCRELKIPYIGAFHLQPQHISYNMFMDFDWFNDYLYRRFYRHFFAYIHHIHCPSQLIAKELERVSYKAKTYVISNGFEENKTASSRQEWRDDGFFHIATIGRLSKEKRQDVLIQAIAKNPYAKKIKLHLHGLGPREKYLFHLCTRLLGDRFEFGFMENSLLMQKLSSMHLYIHPAQVESEAIACLEAISLGVVPIIADSKISATNQFALDDRSLFKTNDVLDLSHKITYWLEHPEELKSMRQAYEKSTQKYTLSLSVDQILEVYEEAIRDFRDHPHLFHTIN